MLQGQVTLSLAPLRKRREYVASKQCSSARRRSVEQTV